MRYSGSQCRPRLGGVLEKVLIVGQGYVGFPLAIRALESGFKVVGVDVDARRVGQILDGIAPTPDVPPETVREAIGSGNYLPTNDFSEGLGFDVAVVTVPTPLRDGQPDLSFIQAAASSLSPLLTPHSTVILESTTYPGTTEELFAPALEKHSGLKAGVDFHLGYSPERIDPGNTQWTLANTPKVVSGIDADSLQAVDSFYSRLGITTVQVSGTREAELTKLLENTFRHVNIALVNELAMFSSALDVDIWESIQAASSKPFGFMKFTPGPGVGGHCLPVDPSYLSWAVKEKAGSNFRFVELANTVNSYMPQFVSDKAVALLRDENVEIKGATILLSGLTYKPNSSDIRESPAIEIAKVLSAQGLSVSAIDPHVPDYAWPEWLARAHETDSRACSLGILLTGHDTGPPLQYLENCAVILDTRNSLDREDVFKL